jgi:hypothetical protein
MGSGALVLVWSHPCHRQRQLRCYRIGLGKRFNSVSFYRFQRNFQDMCRNTAPSVSTRPQQKNGENWRSGILKVDYGSSDVPLR